MKFAMAYGYDKFDESIHILTPGTCSGGILRLFPRVTGNEYVKSSEKPLTYATRSGVLATLTHWILPVGINYSEADKGFTMISIVNGIAHS